MGKRPNVPAGTVVLTSSSRRVGGAGRRWMQKKKSRLHFKKSLVSLDSLQSVRAHAHVYKHKGTHLRHWETHGVFSRDLSVWSKPVTHTVHVLRLSTSDNSPVRSHMFTLSAIVAPILQRQHNNFKKKKKKGRQIFTYEQMFPLMCLRAMGSSEHVDFCVWSLTWLE